MSRIGRRGTVPELAVRVALRRLGHRLRGDRSDLPGTPDLTVLGFKVAIFVHGCFWHRHSGCRFTTTPSSNRKFWTEKFARNVARDRRVARRLRALGWSVITIWECATRDSDRLQRMLSSRIARTREGSKVCRSRRRSEG
jgi:DNA mismatch endonuclease (patch repair protein)